MHLEEAGTGTGFFINITNGIPARTEMAENDLFVDLRFFLKHKDAKLKCSANKA